MARYVGLVVSGLAALIAGYEFVALLTPLPTVSRIVQGWRDDGNTLCVFLLTLAVFLTLIGFAFWLFGHLLFDPRSNELGWL